MALLGASDNLRDTEVKSFANVRAQVLQSLAGRVRRLYELATGAPAQDDAAPATTRNPQGLLGVDFSGPPWGSAWRHPLGGCGGLKPDTSGAGQWVGHRTLGTCSADHPLHIPVNIIVRPFAPAPGAPYSRGYPLLSLYKVSGNCDVVVRCLPRPGSDVGAQPTDTVSVTSTSETFFDPDTFWDLQPGINKLVLELTTTDTNGATLASFSVNNVAKRSHL